MNEGGRKGVSGGFWLTAGASLLLLTLGWGAAPVRADDAPANQRQTREDFETEIRYRAKLPYLLYLPKEYDAGDQRWPLLIFLHGAGETGDDIEKVKIHGPPKLISQGQDFPFIVVSPQTPQFGWDRRALDALLDDLEDRHRIDPRRIYLTGLSMGGAGTWDWAAHRPERFAAIVPICGRGSPREAAALKEMPVWAFHGARDTAVPLKASEDMIAAIRRAGGEPKFTVYPDAAHDSWTETYANPELYRWLLEQRRK